MTDLDRTRNACLAFLLQGALPGDTPLTSYLRALVDADLGAVPILVTAAPLQIAPAEAAPEAIALPLQCDVVSAADALTEPICPFCKESFTPRRKGQIYCIPAHRTAFYNSKHEEAAPVKSQSRAEKSRANITPEKIAAMQAGRRKALEARRSPMAPLAESPIPPPESVSVSILVGDNRDRAEEERVARIYILAQLDKKEGVDIREVRALTGWPGSLATQFITHVQDAHQRLKAEEVRVKTAQQKAALKDAAMHVDTVVASL